MEASTLAGVHGIRNYGYLRDADGDLPTAVQTIAADWSSWIGRGFEKESGAGSQEPCPVAYYADCLFRGDRMGAGGSPRLTPFAEHLLAQWIEEVRSEEQAAAPTPLVSQGRLTSALRSMSEWFTERYGQRALRLVTATVSELAAYFDPAFPEERERARERVAALLRERRPKVLLAHSLGSVVAYEALSRDPRLRVELLVTLGSPLAMRTVVFDRLAPPVHGRGTKPPGVVEWVNIADRGDPVAVPKGGISERFSGVVRDHTASIHLVDPHMVKNYLRCAELVGEIRKFLRDGPRAA
ncbi:hypothetical protein [Streptomyces sp. enrichment culture]|uniref:hypothetical protein n=1 Tax=Streptomyces sp. enrichment culture TaxID=1795815 RepID=UPI003F56559A